MLTKVLNPEITAHIQTVQIDPDAWLYVKILRGPHRSGRTALYIHGGGGGGNHTIIERPARHLIQDGFFDTLILPDKRGDGGSSALTGKHTILDHAQDMRRLLDCLHITGPLTAMGISYGGPIALGLAHLDARIERVILVASSPALSAVNGMARWMLKTGLLRRLMTQTYKRNLGKLPPAYVDFDACHEMHSPGQLMKLYTQGLQRTSRDRLGSLLYALEATLDEAQSNLPDDVRLSIPVIQVVGERDEVWGSRLAPEYINRFPRYRQYIVPGARVHKDCMFKPEPFYRTLSMALRHEFNPSPVTS